MTLPCTVTLEDALAQSVREAVLDGLRSYNRQHAPPPEFTALTISARDDHGRLIAGLVGETGWRWLHVELLWVEEPARQQGLGRALLRAAEQEAMRRGCLGAYLDTFEFQARAFYERQGYAVFGVQEDYPPGSRRLFLRKALTERRAPVSTS